jgi:hypothetical protein
MPRGIYSRAKVNKKKGKTGPNHSAAPRPRAQYRRTQGQVVVNGMALEPSVPVCHIERGSGGDIRYSVRAPGLTPDQAREAAQEQFAKLKMFVEGLGKPQN